MSEVYIDPIFAAFEFPDNESSEAAFKRADDDPEVNNVSVWRTIVNGRFVIVTLGESQDKMDTAAKALMPGALGNFLLDDETKASLMKRRYETAFKSAKTVLRGGKPTLQQRAYYGEQGVPFIDGEPRP
jgi:hypothetical protein